MGPRRALFAKVREAKEGKEGREQDPSLAFAPGSEAEEGEAAAAAWPKGKDCCRCCGNSLWLGIVEDQEWRQEEAASNNRDQARVERQRL